MNTGNWESVWMCKNPLLYGNATRRTKDEWMTEERADLEEPMSSGHQSWSPPKASPPPPQRELIEPKPPPPPNVGRKLLPPPPPPPRPFFFLFFPAAALPFFLG